MSDGDKWDGKDTNGRPYAKIGDVDKQLNSGKECWAEFDDGFEECIAPGRHQVYDGIPGPYVKCRYGRHYLLGSTMNGFYMGVYGPFEGRGEDGSEDTTEGMDVSAGD